MCLTCAIEEVTGLDLSTEEGHDELEKLGRVPWPEATKEMLECAGYITALYGNPAGDTGGPLHVVVDDNNVDDENLAFGRKNIEEWGEYEDDKERMEKCKVLGGWILDLLEPLTPAERSVTIELGCGSLTHFHGKVYMPTVEVPIKETITDAEGNVTGWAWGIHTRTVKGDGTYGE